MVLAGGAAMARELGDGLPLPSRGDWLLVLGGVGLCLFAFMFDALGVLVSRGLEAAFEVRGGPFPWPPYIVGAALISIGMLRGLTRASA
jgi:hypothetical protein